MRVECIRPVRELYVARETAKRDVPTAILVSSTGLQWR